MTAEEFKKMLSEIDFNSLTDEELAKCIDSLSIKLTEIKCISIRRKHLLTHYSPKEKRAN